MMIMPCKLVHNFEFIFYDAETPNDLIEVLENIRAAGTRVRLWYGNASNGNPWVLGGRNEHEEGRIGVSGGSVKSLLIATHRRRRQVPTSNVLKVEHSNKKSGGVIWLHPQFR